MKRNVTKALVVSVLTLAMAASFALVGCTSGATNTAATTEETAAPAVELQIFAANSLEKALPEVQALYTEANPNVTFADTQFEASGTLVTKLKEDSTAADILITASSSNMDAAVTNVSVDEATRVDMFSNDLAICVQEGSDLKITSIADLATDAVTSIAIGDPNTVPAGKYACQALQSAGLCTVTTADDGTITVEWDASIASKINAGADKVGTVASYVQSGTCQVGFVYSSDIYRYDGIQVAYVTPDDSHKSILYPGAVCADSANAEAAADFLDFCLTDPEAQKIFSEYGFELVS